MSGGYFDYACFHASDSEVFQNLENFYKMERYCRAHGEHEAVDEVLRFILLVETCMHRLDVAGTRIAPLLTTIEWKASGDGGNIKAEMEKLINGTNA